MDISEEATLLFSCLPPFALGSNSFLTLLHSERPKLDGVLAVLSAIGLRVGPALEHFLAQRGK